MNKKFRSEKYRRHIAGLPCLICHQESQCCHIRTGTDGGMGLKPSDFFCIPLCPKHHHDQHQIGEREFWNKYGGIERALEIAKELFMNYNLTITKEKQ